MSPTPPRTAWSTRRTASVDMTWPEGERGPLALRGRARDLLTRTGPDDTVVLADETADTVLAADRTVVSIRTAPRPLDLAALVGAGVAGGYRRRLAAAVPAEATAGTPTHLLLDDLVGSAIVAEFALRQWNLWAGVGLPRRVLGLCTGFGPGSNALNPDGSSTGDHRTTAVEPLPAAGDPAGWHQLPDQRGVAMRRARRIDVRRDGPDTVVDAMFQDSSTDPGGGRMAVHEYRIAARADAGGVLTALAATPRTLPYAECPFAAANLPALVGTPLVELRRAVATGLRGTAGCTHLNDAVRALADVPRLLAAIPTTHA
jgi:hypothetical protein